MDLNAAHNLNPWTSIRSGLLPCSRCGIAVAVPVDNYGSDDVELLEVLVGEQRGRRVMPALKFAVTQCGQCAMIRQSARDLLGAHPAVRQRIGSAEIAVYRLESALDALDLLGVTDSALIDRLTTTGADLTALMHALTLGGGLARWVTQPRSAFYETAAATPASSTRWAHVTPELRQELRNKAAGLLARRVERPVDVLAPSEGNGLSGCLLCGVYAVQALRADAEEVWTLMSADAATIGGRPQPESLDGVVCPRCDLAIDAAHGVGSSAMTLSVRSFLGVPNYVRALGNVSGLVGWAALPSGTPPNREPWDHIDLADLRDFADAVLERSTRSA